MRISKKPIKYVDKTGRNKSYYSSGVDELRNYLVERKDSLFNHLKMWDLKDENKILYKHLNDALSVKFFKFDTTYKEMLLQFSMKYLVTTEKKMEDYVIDIEKMCYDLL